MYNGFTGGQIVGLSQTDSLHHLTRLLAGDGVHEEVLHEHARSSRGRISALGGVCSLEVNRSLSFRSERSDDTGCLAVGAGHTVALRLGCEDDELQVCSVCRNVLELELELLCSEGDDGL